MADPIKREPGLKTYVVRRPDEGEFVDVDDEPERDEAVAKVLGIDHEGVRVHPRVEQKHIRQIVV